MSGSEECSTACEEVRLTPLRAWSLAAVALTALSLAFASGARATPAEGIHNIKHVVMIMQENRAFDSYFGTYPGANGIPAHVCVPDPANGGCQAPYHLPRDINSGGPHGSQAAVKDINGGAMNGFVATQEKGLKCVPGEARCLPCNSPNAEAGSKCVAVMGYHDAREIPNYWTYAHNFVLQDNMFQSAASWSEPEHYYLVSGWSAVCPNGDTNPLDCVNRLPEAVVKTPHAWTDITYPLAKAHVSWRYYLFEGSEPDCEQDEAITCTPVGQNPKTWGIWNPLPGFTDVAEDQQLGNVQSIDNLYTAVHEQPSCGLPNVSWVVPNGNVSEHPPGSISTGQAYVTTLINSIMRSPCWGSTAIFVSWDDWGGFYDHVVPPKIDENGYGLRVPGLVISPYAKTGYVDHEQLSHDAYLKFIEDDFLAKARLNPATDGRPDRRPDVRESAPGLGDLANDFNFNQAPRSPVLLSAHPAPGPASQPPGSVAAPAVETGAASALAQSGAKVGATVNPNGATVSDCHFDYGRSASYGASMPCAVLPASGTSPVEVSAQLEGLSANAGYHFRVVASDAGGTNVGADATFATLPNPPTVETGAAGSVAQTKAGVGATVNPNGGTVSDCHFDYGTSASYGSSVPCAVLPGSGTSAMEVSAQPEGLSANVTYHFRIVASNAGGTSVGADATFATLPNSPTVETGAASSIAQTKATVVATVNPNGGTVSDCHVDYGTSASYGASAPCAVLPGSGTSAVGVAAQLEALSANAGYHFRVVASNAGGTSVGADATFATLPNPPTLETGVASSLTQTTASVGATVNPNGGTVSDCHFDYGTSSSYGASVPCAVLPGSGASAVEISAQLEGLSADATYHFRVVASNAGGTSVGADATFATLPNPPTLETGVASSVAQTKATVGATVNPNGGSVSDCRFEYGTSVFYESSQPCSALPGSGTSAVEVSAQLEGLSANVTYHFRVVASNAGGTSVGGDATFATPPNPPTVTSVNPSAGPEAGGSTVTLEGTNLSEATSVRFGSGSASSFTVVSDTSITAVSPRGTGTVDVTVTTPGGTSARSASDRFLFAATPAVAKVAPVHGSAEGGTTVTITGTGLTAATAVKFGSTAAAGFTVASATSITAVSPPSTDGVVDVVVTTPGGSSPRSTNDRYAFTPTVTALSPSSGPAAGATAVIITGTGFGMGPAGTIFRFGPSKATAVNCTSTTTCAVVAPAGVAGSVDVTATLNRVSSPKSAADEYTYN